MQIILLLLLLGISLYLLQTLFIYIGTHRLNYPKTNRLPKISILVALRDEEQTLEPCVESLLQLDYAKESFEILLINDRSSDRTPELIEELKKSGLRVACGKFGAHMVVSLDNDGPVTLIVNSRH